MAHRVLEVVRPEQETAHSTGRRFEHEICLAGIVQTSSLTSRHYVIRNPLVCSRVTSSWLNFSKSIAFYQAMILKGTYFDSLTFSQIASAGTTKSLLKPKLTIMNIRIRSVASIVPSLWLLASCAPIPPMTRSVYRSTPVDVPGLTRKGDSQLAVGVGGNTTSDSGSGQSGLDLKGAYAVASNWTITGGYSQRTGIDNGNNDTIFWGVPNRYPSDSSNLRYRNANWNAGIVFTQHVHGPFYLMAAAGGGMGNFDISDQGVYHDTSFQSPFNCRFYDYYLQAGMLFKVRNVDMGGGLRNTWYQYRRVTTNYYSAEQQAFGVNGLQGTALSLAQLYGFVRVYMLHRILSVNLQWSVDGASASNRINYNGYPISGTFGIGMDISRFVRKMRAPKPARVF